jgi:broad specificity phosphatase PhoE
MVKANNTKENLDTVDNNKNNNKYKTPERKMAKKIRRRIDGSPIVPVDLNLPIKKLLLIRHGESVGQAAKSNGWDRKNDLRLLDCALTRKGESQALGVSKLFSEEDRDAIELVVSSPLQRALQTALLAFPEKNILIGYDLREVGSMVPENCPRPIEDVMKDVNNLVVCRSENVSIDLTSLRPQDWPRDFSPRVLKRDRIRKFFHSLYYDRDETTIAVVCHYNVIRSAVVDGSSLRPMNALPIVCDLYSNGDVILCSDVAVGRSKE